jgi:hypothetical protein
MVLVQKNIGKIYHVGASYEEELFNEINGVEVFKS